MGAWLFLALSFPSEAQVARPGVDRDKLTAAELLAGDIWAEGPVHNGYFMPVGVAAAAKHELSATLTIEETQYQFGAFPGVSVQLFTHRGNLLPAARDIIRSSHSYWDIIFSPGRVWSEPGDDGRSRASLPFALTNPVRNKAHNGLATFLYDDAGISSIVFQLVQETASTRRFDAWGRLPATLKQGDVEGRDAIAREYERELEERLPVRPWSELEIRYGPGATALSNLWPESEYTSVSGLVADGTIYIQPCRTRFGPYPYCDEMRHGVYSMTKSLGALVAMLRLAQKYGDAVFDKKIRDYVEVTAEHDGWNEVTFADALNMTTGIGDAPVEYVRLFEDTGRYNLFMHVKSGREKLGVAFESGNYPWGPGEVFRYRSMDTFVLAAAMDGYLKSQEGTGAHLWDMVVDEVLRPIGVFHAPMMHSVESDGARGIPILGEGIFPTFHDVAKIGLLLENSGRYRRQQILSASKLEEALYRTGVRGKPTPTSHSRFPNFTYHMSLWHFPIELADCTVDVVNMFGYEGNTAQLLPFGMITFYLQDGGINVYRQLADSASRLRSFCGPPTR